MMIFLYTADVISLDNFYIGEESRFSGEKRSVTTFSYRTSEIDGASAVVEKRI